MRYEHDEGSSILLSTPSHRQGCSMACVNLNERHFIVTSAGILESVAEVPRRGASHRRYHLRCVWRLPVIGRLPFVGIGSTCPPTGGAGVSSSWGRCLSGKAGYGIAFYDAAHLGPHSVTVNLVVVSAGGVQLGENPGYDEEDLGYKSPPVLR
jgi:hypothetical protein